jgi:hypothetical protein
VLEIASYYLSQTIISKADYTTGLNCREWYLRIKSDNTIAIFLIDESINVEIDRTLDSPLSNGWHSYAITYDGAGGANAADTIKIYIDGEIVASTATNNASYVAMENLSVSVLINALEGPTGEKIQLGQGDGAMVGIDGSIWSAMNVWRFHQLCKGLYGI